MVDKQDHNSIMCRLDVDSLFTNVPLEETTEIVIKNIFGRKRKTNGLSKSDFQNLLKLTTMGTVFFFKGSYYKELDNVSMGSPLGKALTNIFLCHHGKNGFKNVQLHRPQFFINVTSMKFLFR